MVSIFFALVSCVVWGCNGSTLVQEQAAFYREEIIDGKRFSYRFDTKVSEVEVVRKECWKLDGKVVDHETYDELKCEAELNEIRRKDAQEYADQQQAFNDKINMRRCIVKKLLEKLVQFFTGELEKLKRHHLESYFVFSESTFASKSAYENFITTTLLPARDLLHAQEVSLSDMQAMHAQLSAYEDRFKLFVQTTLHNAVETCNDTKILKELLVLVS